MSDSPNFSTTRQAAHFTQGSIRLLFAPVFLTLPIYALIHRVKELSAELTIKTQQLVHLQEARGSRGLKHTEHVMGDLHQTVEGLSREVAAKNAEIQTLQVGAAQMPSHHITCYFFLKTPFTLVCPSVT